MALNRSGTGQQADSSFGLWLNPQTTYPSEKWIDTVCRPDGTPFTFFSGKEEYAYETDRSQIQSRHHHSRSSYRYGGDELVSSVAVEHGDGGARRQ
jgi:hypothetical protein